MKREMIRLGEHYAVEHPRDEADRGFGLSRAVVKAKAIAYAEEELEIMRRTLKGVRFVLEEPLRVIERTEAGYGFRELPVGHEFFAESRLVHRTWGIPPGVGAGREFFDEERLAARAVRYAEQDAIREALSRLGLRSGFEFHDDEVRLDRAKLAGLLKRTDPVAVAEDVAREVFDHGGPVEDFEAVLGEALEEARQGLAVSDEEISGEAVR